MFSLIVGQEKLPDESSKWPQLSLVAGVAAATAAQSEVPQVVVQLKWPNDLYIGGRKLAGILVEAVPRATDGRMAFVVGIGLNVAVDWSQADAELRARACSLSQFADREVIIESVLIRVVEQLEHWLLSWKNGEPAWWEQWSQHSLLTGRTVELQLPTAERLLGQCAGIDTNGRLLVRDAQQCHRIQSAEVVDWR